MGRNGNGGSGERGAGDLVTVESLTKLRSSSEKMNSGCLREPGRQQVLSAVPLTASLQLNSSN